MQNKILVLKNKKILRMNMKVTRGIIFLLYIYIDTHIYIYTID